MDISRAKALVIYSLTTDRQPVISWAKNHLLARLYIDFAGTHKERRKIKCMLHICPFSAISLKEILSITLTKTEAFRRIRKFLKQENGVKPSIVVKMKSDATRQIKMT